MICVVGIRIKVAGVAGSLLKIAEAALGTLGDFVEDRGIAGGGIRTSVNGSGDTELSLVCDSPELCFAPELAVELPFIASIRSEGIEVTDGGRLRLCGFMAGDCLTLLAGVLVDMLPFRRPRLAVVFDLLEASEGRSAGEIGSAFEPRTCCASIAGELNGLKNSLELTYSGIRKEESKGVWAGDTNGVKEIWARL